MGFAVFEIHCLPATNCLVRFTGTIIHRAGKDKRAIAGAISELLERLPDSLLIFTAEKVAPLIH